MTPRISDLFNALVCFVFQTAPPPVEPPLTIRPETFPVTMKVPPVMTPTDMVDDYIEPPAYDFGAAYYKLGTWKTKAEAKAHAADFRLEMQVRDKNHLPNSQLSPWSVIVMVVPDLHNTYSIMLNGVSPRAGDALCWWLTHDGGPYAVNEDGSPWVAWPAWTTRNPWTWKKPRDTGRTCKKAGGW